MGRSPYGFLEAIHLAVRPNMTFMTRTKNRETPFVSVYNYHSHIWRYSYHIRTSANDMADLQPPPYEPFAPSSESASTSTSNIVPPQVHLVFMEILVHHDEKCVKILYTENIYTFSGLAGEVAYHFFKEYLHQN